MPRSNTIAAKTARDAAPAACLSLLLLAGAIPLVGCAGATSSPDVGGYMFLAGELISDIDEPFEPVLAAVTASLPDVRLGPPKDSDDASTSPPAFQRRDDRALIRAATTKGKDVIISVRTVAPGRTRLALRVGATGDESLGVEFLSAVRRRLAQAADKPAPPSPSDRAPAPADR